MSVSRKERAEDENQEVFSEEEEWRSAVDEEEEEDDEDFEVASSTASRRSPGAPKQLIVPKIPEAVDDFLRNFLRRAGLSRTLNSFEAEWYRSAQRLLMDTLAMVGPGVLFTPDALTHRQLLQMELETVHGENDRLRQDVLAAGEDLVRTQRERDFHQLQYRRVTEDRHRLMEDFKRLEKHLESYEPALKQLEDTYQAALRQKTLISLKKGRLQNTTEARVNEEKSHIKEERSMKSSDRADKSPTKSPVTRRPKDTEFPVCSRLANPHLAPVGFEQWTSPSSFSLSYSIKAHDLPISCIDLHPRERFLASASDDRSWRLWRLQPGGEKVGEMVLTGEGHSDWLSGCSFHPDGAKLATTSGDAMVRLWDFSRGCCVLVLPGHSQPTWGSAFHSCGHFLASCSADGTAKLWDLNSQRCRLTLRRHTASVNSVCFLPFSNLLLTCSADRTLALWDARLGVCTESFRGHRHPCNYGTFSQASHIMASCDSGGVVNLWDVRKPALAMATVDAGPLAANQVAFSPSGKTLAVAGTDHLVRVVEVDSGVAGSLAGHSGSVQSVAFDHKGETVMSAGSDGMINVWA